MTERFLAVPLPGDDGAPLRVPVPGRDPVAQPLLPDGEVVVMSNYWARRRMHGEVELRAVSEATPEVADQPASDVAHEEQSRSARRKDAR